ncbi:MAG TPA: hypothetical protein VGT99_02385 [Gammaproteobacteria bacterium]|nr:hypothetical protein [Gammaproteobacteria bacterium]
MEARRSACRTASVLFLVIASITAASAAPAITGPKLDAILFTPDALILSVPSKTPEGRPADTYFRFDRKSGAIRRLDSLPPEAAGVPASRVMLDAGDNPASAKSSPNASTFLLTSDGDVYVASGLACAEAAPRTPAAPGPHYAAPLYTADCAPVPVPLKPLESVTAVESYKDFLLLGALTTDYSRGAAVPQPGRGMLVISKKDGRLLRTVTRDDGLNEDLIELIRRDPDTGGLWVESPRALAELSPDFAVQRVFFLHLVLDPASGAPGLAAGVDPEYDDPYAMLATHLRLKDYSGYAHSVARLPPELRDRILNDYFRGFYPSFTSLPVELNPLLPFFAESALNSAADYGPSFARDNLCRFHDPGVKDAADKLIKAPLPAGSKGAANQNWTAVHSCASPQVSAAGALCPAGSTFTYPQCVMPGAGQGHVVMMGGSYVQAGSGQNGSMTVVSPGIMTHQTPGHITTMMVAGAGRIQGAILITTSLSPPLFYWDGKRGLRLKDVTLNDGQATAAPSVTRYYLSPTAPVDPLTAQVLTQRQLGPLAGLQSDSRETEIQPPADLPRGIYYLAACPDAEHDVAQAAAEGRCVIPLPGVERDHP